MARAILTYRDFKSLPIPKGLGFWWLGTYVGVPSNFIIDSGACSNRYPKTCATTGSAVDATGGAGSHNHTLGSHSHAVASGGSQAYGDTSGCGSNRVVGAHTHADTGAVAGSLGYSSKEPSYIYAIPITYNVDPGTGARAILAKEDLASSALLPWKVLGYWRSDSAAPAGWAKCDGSTVNGVVTPSLLGKYLRGVPTTGTTPGATGGSSTHTHASGHTHNSTGPVNNTYTADYGLDDCDGPACAQDHDHNFNSASPSIDDVSNEPAYATIHFVCFVGYGSSAAAHAKGTLKAEDLDTSLLLPRGVVLGWGQAESVPSGHPHLDGGSWNNGTPTGYGGTRPNALGRFMRHVTSVTTDGGTTGGADTHSHTIAAHAHRSGITGTSAAGYSGAPTGKPHAVVLNTHQHDVETTTLGSSAGVNHLPAYREVAWIVKD